MKTTPSNSLAPPCLIVVVVVVVAVVPPFHVSMRPLAHAQTDPPMHASVHRSTVQPRS